MQEMWPLGTPDSWINHRGREWVQSLQQQTRFSGWNILLNTSTLAKSSNLKNNTFGENNDSSLVYCPMSTKAYRDSFSASSSDMVRIVLQLVNDFVQFWYKKRMSETLQ